ncbi:MAG: hypothetical protein JNJ45_03405 [Chthonomonas sp.]|nr:hypothetical protein [Chthonomonas sp.]
MLPKVYEGTLELVLGEPPIPRTSGTSQYTPDVDRILNKSSTASAETERQIVSSASVFYQALSRVAERKKNRDLLPNFQQLYQMYDVVVPRTNAPEETATVVQLKVRMNDPAVARDVASEIANVYNDQRRDSSKKAVADAVAYLEDQLPKAKTSLEEKDNALKAYKDEAKIQDPDINVRDLVGQRSQLETTRDNLKQRLEGLRAQAAELGQKAAALPERRTEARSDAVNPQILTIQGQLEDLKGRRLQLLAVYLPDAPEVKKVDEQIAKRTKEIADIRAKTPMQSNTSTEAVNSARQAIEVQRDQVNAEAEGVAQSLAQAESSLSAKLAEVESLPEKQSKLAKLTGDYVVARGRFESIQAQITSLKDRGETQFRVVTALGQAQADPDPVSPDLVRWMFLGLVFGLCGGLIWSFLLESMRLRVHTSSQLTELTGLPVSAAVPVLKMAEGRGLRAFTSPNTPPLESYRYMTFAKLTPTDVPKSFMFTGVKNAAGSFTGALNLAKASAQAGYKVLLVDGDLIRQGISKSFDTEGKRGFSNLLSEDPASLSNAELVQTTGIDNLFVLPAGNATITAVTDVPVQRIESVMTALKKYADVVIFAMAPCDVIADASAVAHYVDETCLVVSARTTVYRQIPAAADLLAKAGAKNLQIILTDANSDEEPFMRQRSITPA